MITDSNIYKNLIIMALCHVEELSVQYIKTIILHAYALLIFFILDIKLQKILNMLFERKYIWKISQKSFREKIKCQLLTPNMSIFIIPL